MIKKILESIYEFICMTDPTQRHVRFIRQREEIKAKALTDTRNSLIESIIRLKPKIKRESLEELGTEDLKELRIRLLQEV